MTHHNNSRLKTDMDTRTDICGVHTATARLSDVTLSSSDPTDMLGSKMAPAGSIKDTVKLS